MNLWWGSDSAGVAALPPIAKPAIKTTGEKLEAATGASLAAPKIARALALGLSTRS